MGAGHVCNRWGTVRLEGGGGVGWQEGERGRAGPPTCGALAVGARPTGGPQWGAVWLPRWWGGGTAAKGGPVWWGKGAVWWGWLLLELLRQWLRQWGSACLR